MDTLEFRQPLWKRLLFGEELAHTSPNTMVSTHVNNLVGGKKEIYSNLSSYFKKLNVLLLVFVISVFFAVLIMRTKSMIKPFFPEDDVDVDFRTNSEQHVNKRKTRIYRMTIVFITFIILCYIIIVIILLLGFFVSKYFTNDMQLKQAWHHGVERIINIFWKDNEEKTLVSFYIVAFTVLIVLYLFYMFFLL